MTFDGIITAIIFVIGYVVSLFIHHIKLSHELNFIKGQLSMLIKMVEKVDDIKEMVVDLNTRFEKARYDLDNAHTKIRKIAGGE